MLIISNYIDTLITLCLNSRIGYEEQRRVPWIRRSKIVLNSYSIPERIHETQNRITVELNILECCHKFI